MRLEGEGIWDTCRGGWFGGEMKRWTYGDRQEICIVAVVNWYQIVVCGIIVGSAEVLGVGCKNQQI
jgi:hypothetical protein